MLEVKNLTKTYNGVVAVQDVNFTLEQGKMLCILGPSGCGKTTILRAIGGFLEADEGQILLDGKDITKTPAEERETATVFQSYGLFPHMTVYQNIVYGLKLRKVKRAVQREKGLEMIELVGLSGHEDKNVNQLSGGQRQRVALGRSLIIEPKLLLLDEPLSNLDEKLRLKMREDIVRFQKVLGVTAIFVTHDQHEAFAIGDEVMVMNRGLVVERDTPEKIYHHPGDAFSLEFIGESTRWPGGRYVRPERVRESGEGMEVVVEGVEFRGATTLYHLRGPEGALLMETLNQTDRMSYQRGDALKVVYDEQQIERRDV